MKKLVMGNRIARRALMAGQVLVYLTLSTSSLAGSQTGQVTQVSTRASDGITWFNLSGTPTGRPGCATSQSYWMIKDENSNTGKRQIAMLIAAKATGQQITVYGSNTCTRWGDGEDVESVAF